MNLFYWALNALNALPLPESHPTQRCLLGPRTVTLNLLRYFYRWESSATASLAVAPPTHVPLQAVLSNDFQS